MSAGTLGQRINTKFSRDYETQRIVCYICGCKCALIGSREHEIPCLVDWLKKYPKHEEFAPTMPKPYPDPFKSTAQEIAHYNQKAARSAKLCDENTQKFAAGISSDVKDLPSLKAHEDMSLTEQVIAFEKLGDNLNKQDVSTAEKKRGVTQKMPSKTTVIKTLLRERLVEFMDKYALHVTPLQDPGRVPKGQQYAYNLDESPSKDLLLHPCYVDIDEQRSRTSGNASLVSRKKIRITAEESRKRFD